METLGVPVVDEIMAGSSFRRRLNPRTIEDGIDVNYLLQVTFAGPEAKDGMRVTASYYVKESNRLLGMMALPGVVTGDVGGLEGLVPERANLAFRSTGFDEQDTLVIYSPWRRASWNENGKTCMMFCGILPPQPQFEDEYHCSDWDTRYMRKGRLVFAPTPANIESY